MESNRDISPGLLITTNNPQLHTSEIINYKFCQPSLSRFFGKPVEGGASWHNLYKAINPINPSSISDPGFAGQSD